jgi:perosamine synthetase
MAKHQHKAGEQIIPLSKPWCDARGLKGVYQNYITNQWKMGPTVREFEDNFSKYINKNNSLTAVSIYSNKAGYKIILQCIGIKKNDEIIITPLSSISILNAIISLGAIPVFADIEYDSLNIDYKDVEKKITPNTKTIIIEHYGGYPCNMDQLMMIADKNKILIIEDCSNATGGEYNGLYSGEKIGSIGNISYFSMGVNNILPMGIGSMIVFPKNIDFETRIKEIRDFDEQYQMSDLLAVIGVRQLEELDRLNGSRRLVVDRYNKHLSKYKQIEYIPFSSNKDVKNNYIVKIHGIPINNIKSHLESKNISVKNIYPLVYYYPKYQTYNKNDTPIAESVSLNTLILPLYPSLRKEDVGYILKEIKHYIRDTLESLNQKVYKEPTA